jgi:hypothetical protein
MRPSALRVPARGPSSQNGRTELEREGPGDWLLRRHAVRPGGMPGVISSEPLLHPRGGIELKPDFSRARRRPTSPLKPVWASRHALQIAGEVGLRLELPYGADCGHLNSMRDGDIVSSGKGTRLCSAFWRSALAFDQHRVALGDNRWQDPTAGLERSEACASFRPRVSLCDRGLLLLSTDGAPHVRRRAWLVEKELREHPKHALCRCFSSPVLLPVMTPKPAFEAPPTALRLVLGPVAQWRLRCPLAHAATCRLLVFADPPFNLNKDYGPGVKTTSPRRTTSSGGCANGAGGPGLETWWLPFRLPHSQVEHPL